MPTSSEQKEFMASTNLFHKETAIYSELLAPMLSTASFKFAARSYFSRDDILVLDDLSVQGYTLMPSRVGLSRKHVRIVLKSLAEMHARSMHFEQEILKKPLDKVYDETLFEVQISRDIAWFTTGLKTIEMMALKRSKYAKDPEVCQLIRDKFMKGLDRIYDLVREVPKKYKKVLCHRDIWPNNLMFKFETSGKTSDDIDYSNPLDCILVDFQLARCLPPAVDIMMALYMLQRTKERETDFLDNLKHYHGCLGTSLKWLNMNIEEVLPFHELIDSCEHFRLLGVLIKAVYVQTTLTPNGEMDKLRIDDSKFRDFIVNDRSLLLEYVDTDELFRDWMLEAVEELVEMILFEEVGHNHNEK